MIKLLETLRVKDGNLYNINYHNARLNYSREQLFGLKNRLDILDFLPKLPQKGLKRVRVIYSENIESIEVFDYTPKLPFSFKVVEFKEDYSHKYLNREPINTLKRHFSNFDELILSRDKELGDTTIANIALLINGSWFTPANPILRGTTRERYLKNGILKEARLKVEDLREAKKIALLNAMVDFMVVDDFEVI